MKKCALWLMIALLVSVVSCQGYNAAQTPQAGYVATYDKTVETYLEQAAQSTSPVKEDYQLSAAGRLLQEDRVTQAEEILNTLDKEQLTPAQNNHKLLLAAQLNLLQHQPESALATLNQLPDVPTLAQSVQIAYYQQLSLADAQMNNMTASAKDLMSLDALLSGSAQEQNRALIWKTLQEVPTNELSSQIDLTSNSQEKGWLSLTYILKADIHDTARLNTDLQNWQGQYPNHPADAICVSHMSASIPTATQKGQVALLLPESGNLGYAARPIQGGVMVAYHNALFSDPSRTVQPYPASANAVTAYQHAINGGAAAIIGPLSKSEVSALASQSLAVPVLALNFVTTPPSSRNLYQFALSPEDEASQVANKALQDGHTKALIIAPATAWGRNVANAFRQTWQGNGGIVVGEFYSTNQASLDPGIKSLLRVMQGKNSTDALKHRQDADMIFLLEDPVTARQVKPLLRFYYADDLPVYATSMVYSGKPNSLLDNDLNGIQFCDIPFVLANTNAIQAARVQMLQLIPHASAQSYRLFAFGYDAYNLLPRLSTLSNNPSNGYQGLTGMLYMDNQKIKRQLKWAVFRNGVPVLE
ncbi:MAG: penicillin-binding protein activator [Legionellales bacterium]|nr:penicillin-binding protein activator [Legionellales bacterium]